MSMKWLTKGHSKCYNKGEMDYMVKAFRRPKTMRQSLSDTKRTIYHVPTKDTRHCQDPGGTRKGNRHRTTSPSEGCVAQRRDYRDVWVYANRTRAKHHLFPQWGKR